MIKTSKMKIGILFKNRIPNPNKWIIIIPPVLGILIQIKFYQPFILAFFLSSFIILLFGSKLENKSFFPLLFIGLPFIILVIAFFGISFTGGYILFFIPLQVLTLGGLIYYFSGYLFEYLWNKCLAKKWNNLSKDSINSVYKETKIAIITLPLLHLILTISSLMNRDLILVLEQGSISLLFFIIFGWFFRNESRIKNETKKIAASLFFITIIIVPFDLILLEIIYLKDNMLSIGGIFLILFILIGLLNSLFNPQSK